MSKDTEKRLTPQEAVAALDAVEVGDPEGSHLSADAILRRAVAPEVADAYDRVCQRESQGWWWA